MASTNCGEISPPRKLWSRRSRRRRQINSLGEKIPMPQKTENQGSYIVWRTSRACKSGTGTWYVRKYMHAHVTHMRAPAAEWKQYPSFSFAESLFFRRFFFRGLFPGRDYSHGPEALFVHGTMSEGILARYLKLQLSITMNNRVLSSVHIVHAHVVAKYRDVLFIFYYFALFKFNHSYLLLDDFLK